MSLAQQVVFHPYVSQSLKLWSTTLGRDKTYRAIQYFARFYAWFLLSRGRTAEAVRWDSLKVHLGLGRKLMRLGKPLEHLQAALRVPAGVRAEELTTIGRQLCYFGFLSYDAMVWANTVKFVTLKADTAQKVNKNCNRLWLAGIVFSLCNSLFKARRLEKEAQTLRRQRSRGDKDVGLEASRELQSQAIETARKVTRQQLIIDLLDIWIPATNVGVVHMNEGFLGAVGFCSSILALRTQWATAGVKR